jgi:hypothetical protein
MTEQKRLVLDANILLRAVLGVRVRTILETFEDSASFYAPDICFCDARKYFDVISVARKLDPANGLVALSQIARLVESVDQSLYEEFKNDGTGENASSGYCRLADCGNLSAAGLPDLDRGPRFLRQRHRNLGD